VSRWIRRLPEVEKDWNAELQTLEGHSSWVNTVAFSPDGNVLVSGSSDETVKLWDAGTGAVLQTVKVGAVVQTVSFSEDGTFLQTDRGVLLTTSLSSSDNLSQLTYSRSICVKEQWVHWGTKDTLWLPPEYRPRCTAVYGSVVALAYSSGRVLIIEFSYFPRPPPRPPPLQLPPCYTYERPVLINAIELQIYLL
jgi:hypothetical protein